MSANGATSGKPTIVLIHGLWLTPRSWEEWIDRYQRAGYNVIAPSWPGLEGEVEAIAGGSDHIVPPAINKSNVRKYVEKSSAVTDYREFPNRTHHTVGQKGWEEVADFAIRWANMHARGQVTLADVTAAFVPERPYQSPTSPDLRA